MHADAQCDSGYARQPSFGHMQAPSLRYGFHIRSARHLLYKCLPCVLILSPSISLFGPVSDNLRCVQRVYKVYRNYTL